MGELLGVAAVAVQYGVSEARVRQWIASSQLPARKVSGHWVIESDALGALHRRANGRPRKGTPEGPASEERRMGITVAICGRKGGSAKSVTAFNLAGALVQAGLRCLLVDLDMQGSLSRNLLGSGTLPGGGIGERLLAVERGLADLIIPARPHLDLLPGDRSLEASARALAENPTGTLRLRRLLNPLVSLYDALIIDTAPALDFSQSTALQAADVAIIPARVGGQQDLDALQDSLSMRTEFADYGLRVADLCCILPSSYDESFVAQREGLAMLREHYGAALADPVPYSALVERTFNRGVPLVEAYPRSATAAAFRALGQRLLASVPAGAVAR